MKKKAMIRLAKKYGLDCDELEGGRLFISHKNDNSVDAGIMIGFDAEGEAYILDEDNTFKRGKKCSDADLVRHYVWGYASQFGFEEKDGEEVDAEEEIKEVRVHWLDAHQGECAMTAEEEAEESDVSTGGYLLVDLECELLGEWYHEDNVPDTKVVVEAVRLDDGRWFARPSDTCWRNPNLEEALEEGHKVVEEKYSAYVVDQHDLDFDEFG